MDYQLQMFKNVRNNHVGDNISLSQWVSMISGNNVSKEIEKAREGVINIENLKLSIPCVNYSFLFSDYKKNENVIGSTGLLYFDIDDPRFDPEKINKEKVCVMYKSLSGVNYAIIVRCKGLSFQNYKQYYLEVAKDLGIEEYVDSYAAKQVQTNVLSFDKSIYYNINSLEYNIKLYPPSSNKRKEEKRKHIPTGWVQNGKIRFNNIEDFDFEGKTHLVSWNKFNFIKCFIPLKKVEKGRRNSMLLSFANNFLYLNPTASKALIKSVLSSVNAKGCFPRVVDSRLDSVVNTVVKYKKEGSLKPISDKRTIIFNSGIKLTKEEKLKIVGKEIKKHWKSKTCKKIQCILQNWDFYSLGKISIRKISDNHPISKRTVAKYYPEFKEKIKEMNTKYEDKK